ncbi:MAG: hypothetical protein JO189_32535 [Deltaproteobacteria bacterium]|nr:hypothetical protein [Deltaproteobacteria bacterium]
MKRLAYSSTEAFLAHYRVLSNAAAGHSDNGPLSTQERETLDEMHLLMEALAPEECAIMLADRANGERRCESGEDRRRRERAKLRLRRLLLAKGVVRS